MSDQPNRPAFAPNPLDVMSTWLFAEPVAGSTRRPNLRIKVMGNVPRITVKTNVQDDKNHGKIDFNTDLATFSVIMHKIEQMAEGKDDKGFTAEYNDDFVAGKKLDRPMTLASVKVGKDRDTGKLFLAVLSNNRPKIQFFFGPSKYHALKHGDGSMMTDAEVSAAYAIGFVKSMTPMVQALLVNEFNADAKNVAKAPVGAGGGGGGFQQRGGQQPQRQAPAANNSFDEDITAFGEGW